VLVDLLEESVVYTLLLDGSWFSVTGERGAPALLSLQAVATNPTRVALAFEGGGPAILSLSEGQDYRCPGKSHLKKWYATCSMLGDLDDIASPFRCLEDVEEDSGVGQKKLMMNCHGGAGVSLEIRRTQDRNVGDFSLTVYFRKCMIYKIGWIGWRIVRFIFGDIYLLCTQCHT